MQLRRAPGGVSNRRLPPCGLLVSCRRFVSLGRVHGCPASHAIGPFGERPDCENIRATSPRHDVPNHFRSSLSVMGGREMRAILLAACSTVVFAGVADAVPIPVFYPSIPFALQSSVDLTVRKLGDLLPFEEYSDHIGPTAFDHAGAGGTLNENVPSSGLSFTEVNTRGAALSSFGDLDLFLEVVAHHFIFPPDVGGGAQGVAHGFTYHQQTIQIASRLRPDGTPVIPDGSPVTYRATLQLEVREILAASGNARIGASLIGPIFEPVVFNVTDELGPQTLTAEFPIPVNMGSSFQIGTVMSGEVYDGAGFPNLGPNASRVDAGGSLRFFLDPITPGATYTTASGHTYFTIPEPTAVVLFGITVVGLVLRRRSALAIEYSR